MYTSDSRVLASLEPYVKIYDTCRTCITVLRFHSFSVLFLLSCAPVLSFVSGRDHQQPRLQPRTLTNIGQGKYMRYTRQGSTVITARMPFDNNVTPYAARTHHIPASLTDEKHPNRGWIISISMFKRTLVDPHIQRPPIFEGNLPHLKKPTHLRERERVSAVS